MRLLSRSKDLITLRKETRKEIDELDKLTENGFLRESNLFFKRVFFIF